MNTIERPGIHPKWEKQWKRIRRDSDDWLISNDARVDKALEHYTCNGYVPDDINSHLQGITEYAKWESYLEFDLSIYGYMRWYEQEKRGMEGKPFDSALTLNAFSAMYTFEMINLFRHAMFPQRSEGNILQCMGLKMLPFTALGVIVGCKKEAFNLARLQLRAYRKGYYTPFDRDKYPIFHFMLRLLADYLGEPPLVLEGELLAEPIFPRLFDLWHEHAADTLLPVCLAACDFHTHRWSAMGNDYLTNEFSWGNFVYTPIEILLLFKLRQSIGLSNPVVDHPLMNTPLGVLPEEVAFEPGDLIKRVRARMMQDGYNESTISKLYDVDITFD